MYAELTLIVGGSVDESIEFRDETLIDDWLRTVETELRNSGHRGDVYRVDHDHAPGLECECVQYLTDHLPYRVLNPNGS